MTFDELALEILKELIRKSGVREWVDLEVRGAITLAAVEMASNIIAWGEALMSNEIYYNEGTSIQVNGEGGADYALSFEGVANGAGRISGQIDLGAAPRTHLYRWRCQVKCQATPTINYPIRLYKVESDGTYEDQGLGTSNAAVATEPTQNARRFGQVLVQAAGTQVNIAGGIVEINERYVSILPWNATGAAIDATDSNFQFFLTPIYPQTQS